MKDETNYLPAFGVGQWWLVKLLVAKHLKENK
jgi:hypothetical protein